jgi:hypothetical protein
VSVIGAKSFLATAFAAAGMLIGTTAAGAGLELAPGARVGIIAMMSTDVTHYHVGKSPSGSFMRTYRVDWPASEVIDDPLANELTSAGLEPVFLAPSEPLRRQSRAWIITQLQAARLPRAAMEEFDRIATTENLQALVIVAPGPNNNPESVQGNRLRRLPAYVQGWGFSTNDETDGLTRPVVFNLTQMLLISRTGNEAEFEFREWGGAFVYEWADFDPGEDAKALPQSEIDKFRPVIADVLQRQMARLMPHIKADG